MSESAKSPDRRNLAIGGGLMVGLGVGFFFFPVSIFGRPSVFAFIGCIVGGLGVGLLLAASMSSEKGRD